jgi:hypothetical protein
MKKILFFVFALFVYGTNVNAQSGDFPLSDDFESYEVGFDVTTLDYYDILNANSALVSAADDSSDGQFVTMTTDVNGGTFKIKSGAALGGFGNGIYTFSTSIKGSLGKTVKLKIYGGNDHVTILEPGESTTEDWTTITIKFEISGLADTAVEYPAPVIYCYSIQDVYIDNLYISDETTGVTLYEEEFAFTVAPNPSNGVFSITSKKDIAEYSVFNTAGQIIKSEKGLKTRYLNIDISNATPGVYMVKVKDVNGNENVVKQVIK